MLSDENYSRLGIDPKVIAERQRRLKKPGIAQKLMRVYARGAREPAPDPEAALYEGFLNDADRSRCQALQQALSEGRWQDLDYADKRLVTLAGRLKARSFPALLNDAERADWHAFVREKLNATDAPWLTLERFQARVAALRGEFGDEPVLEALAAHGARLEAEYGR